MIYYVGRCQRLLPSQFTISNQYESGKIRKWARVQLGEGAESPPFSPKLRVNLGSDCNISAFR